MTRSSRPIEARAWRDLLHLAGLSALAVAQPTLALIAANAQFLATHDSRGWRLAVLVATLVLGPPLAGGLLELAAGLLGHRARVATHSALVAILVAIVARQALDRLLPGKDAWIVLLPAVGIGIAFAIAYRRFEAARTLVTFLAASTLIVPATFFLDVRVRDFLSGRRGVDLYAVEIPRPVPLVVVIFDELPLATLLDREGETIDADLFPNFARLAAMSNWYPRATTNGDFTVLSVPSLHNGRYSPTDRLLTADLTNYPENLFTLLGSTYDVHALETSVYLRPPEVTNVINRSSDDSRRLTLLLADTAAIALRVTTPRPWSARLPRIGDAWAGFWTGSGRGDRASAPPGKFQKLRDFIAALDPSSRPPLVYIHPHFPHFPWHTLPSGRGYFDLHLTLDGHADVWAHDEWLLLQGYQRHRLQVAAADTILGDLLDRLAALGWWDDAMVVVTSDHGAAFTPGAPRRELRPEQEEILRGEVMPIPLLIKFPGQHTSSVDERTAELVDVLPTIADALDFELPWPVDGRSLLEPAPTAPRRRRVQLRDPYTTLDLDDREDFPAAAVARRRNVAFGRTADGRTDLFAIGPAPDLVGRPVGGAASSPHRAVLEDENLYLGVGEDDPNLPALVRGTIEPATAARLPAGAAIAVAINGVVRATTRVVGEAQGGLSWSALVPEAALAPGDNRVELFLVGDDRTLARLDFTGSQEALRRTVQESPSLFSANGRTGWEGWKGVLGATLERGPDGELVVGSPGGPRRADLPPFDIQGASGIVVAVDLTSDADLTPSLYYQIASEPFFRIGRMVRGSARNGRSTMYIVVEGEDLVGALSIDFGRGAKIRIHSVEVRATR